jgi:isopenicillin N synthase-like dioxygenase
MSLLAPTDTGKSDSEVQQMTTNYEAAAQSLIDRGYALLNDDASLMQLVGRVFSEGREFFQQSDETKRAASSSSKLEGYRPFGAEFSQTPERPDLCEFFSVWCWNRTDPEIGVWASRNGLHNAMSSALLAYSTVANNVLEELRRRLKPQGQKIDASEASYLQMNYYRPAVFERELLQDSHEDGHVLTILKATAPGLEIRVADQFSRIDMADDEFLLLPGGILTLMTGGLISPLFHRVRNDRSSAIRQSLLHFTNPSMAEETTPWIENESNRGISIRTTALSCVGAR